ncbi:GNAT family N-acetyltransferase [Rhodomicrobium sp. Az07]|uniref:GNAT family N-acetyltransferase n=1 Tax=Rhodomicrobium sp. Az07 TaxID=2839034 RepID=UPI001BEAB90F|nr:GNAT family N-acetyltransferase [Rhodomicrobium sp. Az07]MBT3071415.1 GNAT family N-acetyltransferase [Rhodomicrobium sp. Az07]
MINEVYGYSYRPDWHGDLDTLPEQDSPYFPEQRGAFFVLLNAEDDIIGTAGLRALSSRPDIVALTKGRFPNPDSVASHWRMYVDSRYRRMGLGRVLIDLRREAGTEMGYDSIYFHCDRTRERLRRFWEGNGFSCFLEDEMSAHYAGPIRPVE